MGEVVFWKIAMKPGRPLAYGRIGGAHFFGLPGNPVSVMVTFYQFVRDALLKLAGRDPLPPLPTFKVPCTSALKKAPGRTEFQRGILTQDASGAWSVRVTGEQGSGILRSMTEANCFIILPTDQGNVAAGTPVEVQLMPDRQPKPMSVVPPSPPCAITLTPLFPFTRIAAATPDATAAALPNSECSHGICQDVSGYGVENTSRQPVALTAITWLPVACIAASIA